MDDTQWYYVVGSDSKGPFGSQEIEDMIRRGFVGPQTFVWHDGLPAWEAAEQHFDIARMATAPAHGGDGIGPDGLYIGAPSRGFVEALVVCFRKYATFSGRASRSEYWYFVLWQLLIGIGTGLLDVALLGANGLSIFNTVASLILLLPTLAVSWRRLHDIDRSGWWIGGFYIAMLVGTMLMAPMLGGTEMMNNVGSAALVFSLFALVAVVYMIVMLVFFCTRGTLGPNRFG